jgi:hypothetical protein
MRQKTKILVRIQSIHERGILVSPNYITFLLLLSTILLQPIALAEQSTSSWPSLTKHVLLPPNGQKADAFHMVVIGDSIAWVMD